MIRPRSVHLEFFYPRVKKFKNEFIIINWFIINKMYTLELKFVYLIYIPYHSIFNRDFPTIKSVRRIPSLLTLAICTIYKNFALPSFRWYRKYESLMANQINILFIKILEIIDSRVEMIILSCSWITHSLSSFEIDSLFDDYCCRELKLRNKLYHPFNNIFS